MEDLNPGWRTSSHSGNGGECVEVGRDGNGMIVVRDTKNRGGPIYWYTPARWRAFIAGVRHCAMGSGETGRPS